MPYLTLNNLANLEDAGSKAPSGDSREETVMATCSEASVGAIGCNIPAPSHGPVMSDSGYPLVKLDTDIITDTTAARLATSLLGHVLFLKNQVPLPVVQLARISNAKTNPRSLRLRQDLLNSFDTISSHFETTFSALSTALARSRSNRDVPLAQAYLAFLVGPGVRTARARVILGIDGLEKRIWGSRNDSLPLDVADNKSSDSKDDTDTEGDHSEPNEGTDEVAEQPEDSDSEDDEETDEKDSSGSSDDEDAESSRRDFIDSTPQVSRAEEQKFLQSADRLLSRVLANADANGKGIISEMAPTQTYILIRAPRRFVHPAWIPCQNVNAILDGALEEFLRGSERYEVSDLPKQKPSKVPKVEGVWITTRIGIQEPPCPTSPLHEKKPTTWDEEDDDLIWWSWDGKLVGFADW